MVQCLSMVGDDLEAAETELHRLLQSDITVIPAVGSTSRSRGESASVPCSRCCALARRATTVRRESRSQPSGSCCTPRPSCTTTSSTRASSVGAVPLHGWEYGNGLSVLTGDYCLARSLQAVAATGHLRAVQTMGDAVTRMAEGEVAQLHAAGDGSLDRDRYYQVIERKTAALIAWCSSVAGLVNEAYVEPLHRYGLELGYAFQIADDLLDFRLPTAGGGADAATGKDPGQDLREGKVTLPLLLACEGDETLRRRVDEALRAGPPMADHTVRSLVEAVRNCDAPAAARTLPWPTPIGRAKP